MLGEEVALAAAGAAGVAPEPPAGGVCGRCPAAVLEDRHDLACQLRGRREETEEAAPAVREAAGVAGGWNMGVGLACAQCGTACQELCGVARAATE